MLYFILLTSSTLSKVVYFNQLLCAVRHIHVVYSDQILGAARHIHLYLITIYVTPSALYLMYLCRTKQTPLPLLADIIYQCSLNKT